MFSRKSVSVFSFNKRFKTIAMNDHFASVDSQYSAAGDNDAANAANSAFATNDGRQHIH